MPNKVLKLDSQDNVLIALADLRKGEQILFDTQTYTLESDVPANHKFATEDLAAGAAKKGGSSLVTAVLNYPESATTPGLNLQCTPGNDVEYVTAQVGAGTNVVLFTTGLGAPTGNPITPVVKLSTNSAFAQRMPDIIDVDTGAIISGEKSVAQMGEDVLDFVIKVANGEIHTKAEGKGQEDFIPWRRGISL
jgi:altronate hydrolase